MRLFCFVLLSQAAMLAAGGVAPSTRMLYTRKAAELLSNCGEATHSGQLHFGRRYRAPPGAPQPERSESGRRADGHYTKHSTPHTAHRTPHTTHTV